MNFKVACLKPNDVQLLKKYKTFYFEHFKENPNKLFIKEEIFEEKMNEVLAEPNVKTYVGLKNEKVFADFLCYKKENLTVPTILLSSRILKSADKNLLANFYLNIINDTKKQKLKMGFKIEPGIISDKLQANGFKVKNKTTYFELKRKEIDEQKINEILQRDILKEFDLKCNFYVNPTFDLVEKIAAFETTLFNNMIRENNHIVQKTDAREKMKRIENWKSRNRTNLFLLLEKENELVAMSDVLYENESTKIIEQRMTGTKKELNKNGIATWMKAKMSDYLLKNNLSFENLPMIKINKRLGFKVSKSKDELVWEV